MEPNILPTLSQHIAAHILKQPRPRSTGRALDLKQAVIHSTWSTWRCSSAVRRHIDRAERTPSTWRSSPLIKERSK
jgi:hypothetical protein